MHVLLQLLQPNGCNRAIQWCFSLQRAPHMRYTLCNLRRQPMRHPLPAPNSLATLPRKCVLKLYITPSLIVKVSEMFIEAVQTSAPVLTQDTISNNWCTEYSNRWWGQDDPTLCSFMNILSIWRLYRADVANRFTKMSSTFVCGRVVPRSSYCSPPAASGSYMWEVRIPS